jgi:hypothetical protein
MAVNRINQINQVTVIAPRFPQSFQGPPGATGPGVPDGGSANQILRKVSGADQDTGWASPGDIGVPTLAGDNTFTGINAGGQADTIAALAARSVAGLTDGDIIYVSDAYRWGFFRWTTGDQSANVTADPKQGIWVAPATADTGASGAWQRLVDGSIRVDWFIEPGDADDTAGIQAALNYAAAGAGVGSVFQRGTTVVFGRETYTISSTIEPTGFGQIALVGQGLPGSTAAGGVTTTGGTCIIAAHTSGSAFRFKRGPVALRSMRIVGSAARKSGANLSAHGLHFEPEDDASANSRINYVQLQDVRADNHPGIGIAVLGESVGTDFNRVWAHDNGSHGALVDRGTATGRVHTMVGGTTVSTGAMTAASAVLTASSASFVDPTDVGARILVKGAGPNGYDMETTISSVDSATQVTLDVAASTTVSGAVVQYGGFWARPGLGTIRKLNAYDNAGHGLAIGHPADGFQTPYRWIIDDFEAYRNATSIARRFNNHDSWLGGEQIKLNNSATGGSALRNCLLVTGQNIKISNFRAIDSFTSGHGIFVANAVSGRTTANGGADTGVTRGQTDDVLIDGVTFSGATVPDAIRVDDVGGNPVRVYGVRGPYTNLFNAQRNNVLYEDGGNLLFTGGFRALAGSAGALSFAFLDDTDTGLYRAATNTMGFAAGGERVFDFSQGAISLAAATTAAPDGVTISLARGTVTLPAINFGASGADNNTGLFSRTADEVNLAAGGVEILRAAAQGIAIGVLGSAAAPSLFRTADTDTGLFFRTANEVNLAAGGVEIQRNTSAGVDIRTGDLLRGGTKVVGAQGAAIADAAGGTEITTINAILARLRAHGLIAT